MFIAPLSYQIKCPQCGCETSFWKFINQKSLIVRSTIVNCKQCGAGLVLDQSGLTIFSGSLIATVLAVGFIVYAAIYWPLNKQVYLPLIPLSTIMIGILVLRLTKLRISK